jgi:pyrroloquinoline quinone (PQQ) biosynthesis protein C
MRQSRAYNHPLLNELRGGPMDRDGAIRFATQWYKAATAHKRAFPGLIYNTPDDHVRLQLIEILREEYGFGEASRVHARILEKFVRALGLDVTRVASAVSNPEVEAFSREVDEAWSKGDPVKAFGVHFALEYLAANMHKAFFAGVQTLGLDADDIEYFAIHSIAEDEHSRIAEDGMRYLDTLEANRDRLLAGVEAGTKFVEALLDGLARAYSGAVN